MKKLLAVLAFLLSATTALGQSAPVASGACRLDGGAGCGASGGGGGSGDITDVNITATSPLTGTASCSTGACSFTLGLSALVDADISNSAAIAWSKVSKSGALASDVGAVTLWPSNPGTPELGAINLGPCAPLTADCTAWIRTGGLDLGAHMEPPNIAVEATETGNPSDKPAGTYLYTATQLDPTYINETVAATPVACVLHDFGTCRIVVSVANQAVLYSDQGEGTIAYRGSLLYAREIDIIDDGSHVTWSPGTPPLTDTTTHPTHWFSEDGAQVGTIAEFNNLYVYGAIQIFGGSKNGFQPGEEAILIDPNGISPSVGLITVTGGGSFTQSVTAAQFKGGGGAPAVSNTTANSCGTTAATIAGTDSTGKVTVGATGGTSCTLTFVTAATTRRQCWANNETTAQLARWVYTDTTHGNLVGTFAAADVISYGCMVY